MAAFYIKTLKFLLILQTFLEERLKARERLLLLHDYFHCLNKVYAAGDVVPSTKKINMGSRLSSLSPFFGNLRKSSHKIENSDKL